MIASCDDYSNALMLNSKFYSATSDYTLLLKLMTSLSNLGFFRVKSLSPVHTLFMLFLHPL
ncbi:hypothetical protein EBS43_03490 [bacterium]|nr:hypothetical protein [bacterium]